jgi:hypothetical protein
VCKNGEKRAVNLPDLTSINVAEAMVWYDIIVKREWPMYSEILIYSDSSANLFALRNFLEGPWAYTQSTRGEIYRQILLKVLHRLLRVTFHKVKAHLDDGSAEHLNPLHTEADEVAKRGADAETADAVLEAEDVPLSNDPRTFELRRPPWLTGKFQPTPVTVAAHLYDHVLAEAELACWTARQARAATPAYESRQSQWDKKVRATESCDRANWAIAERRATIRSEWMWDVLRACGPIIFANSGNHLGCCPVCSERVCVGQFQNCRRLPSSHLMVCKQRDVHNLAITLHNEIVGILADHLWKNRQALGITHCVCVSRKSLDGESDVRGRHGESRHSARALPLAWLGPGASNPLGSTKDSDLILVVNGPATLSTEPRLPGLGALSQSAQIVSIDVRITQPHRMAEAFHTKRQEMVDTLVDGRHIKCIPFVVAMNGMMCMASVTELTALFEPLPPQNAKQLTTSIGLSVVHSVVKRMALVYKTWNRLAMRVKRKAESPAEA